MKSIINVKHNNDLITIDLRCRQMRFLENHFKGEHNLIKFFDLSHGDIEGYNTLYEDDLNCLYNCLVEDFF